LEVLQVLQVLAWYLAQGLVIQSPLVLAMLVQMQVQEEPEELSELPAGAESP
jgi:hypothetical protein